MCKTYTRQALPERHYRELLGSALCVFNSNNAFLIENILKIDSDNYNWYKLIDFTSGELKEKVRTVITSKCGDEIELLFDKLVKMRNRIVHSFQITNKFGKQVLATKRHDKDKHNPNEQFEITEKYLSDFIELNEQLSDKLHALRGY